jgi:Leucine-rich repeat (LRR) protein
LSVANTPLTTIEPLEELVNLEELDISHTSITSIGPIMHLQNLEKLELSAGIIPREEIERFIELHSECEVVMKQ